MSKTTRETARYLLFCAHAQLPQFYSYSSWPGVARERLIQLERMKTKRTQVEDSIISRATSLSTHKEMSSENGRNINLQHRGIRSDGS